VFQRIVNGLELTFHLAGINNQNFLMRDEQTGTYWQQITGLAVSGPLAGRRLRLVSADELTFALWKAEQPAGTVLKDVPKYVKEYAPRDWDVDMAKAPTVISYAQAGLKARDLMLGIHGSNSSRAFPYQAVLKEKLVQDRVGTEPVILVVGSDNHSVRAFRQRIPALSETPQFYRIDAGAKTADTLLMDASTGSQWNFTGCAVEGKLKGTCLERVDVIRDYWFDWRNYNPGTTVYGVRQRIR
jgi:Protein of unknown function (DUF3179)